MNTEFEQHPNDSTHNDNFQNFIDKYGNKDVDEILERVCNIIWDYSSKRTDGVVTIEDKYKHDAINCTVTGYVDWKGEQFRFIIDNGDWNGTQVVEWGTEEDVGYYQPPKKIPFTFIPADDELKFKFPAMFNVYTLWRKENWFQEMERGYNYDRHFAPGSKTEKYYNDKAAQKGLRVACMDEKELKEYLTPATEEEIQNYKDRVALTEQMVKMWNNED